MTQHIDTATRDRIAADALRWAAERIDPGPRATRPAATDELHDATMCAGRGTATNLRFWADQVERGYAEPRPAAALSGPTERANTMDHPALNTDPPIVRCRMCDGRCRSDGAGFPRWIYCDRCSWSSHDPRRAGLIWRLRVLIGR